MVHSQVHTRTLNLTVMLACNNKFTLAPMQTGRDKKQLVSSAELTFQVISVDQELISGHHKSVWQRIHRRVQLVRRRSDCKVT